MKPQERRWLAFHKPLGVVTTASDEEGRRTVLDFIPDHAGLTYVGPARRDDHRAAAAHDRRRGGASADPSALPHSAPLHRAGARPADGGDRRRRCAQRIVIDGRPVVPSEVARPARDRGAEHRGRHAGRGPQPDRPPLGEAMGLKVDRLARLSYGPVRLGDLAPGRYRPLTPREEAALYKAIRLDPDARDETDVSSGEPGRRMTGRDDSDRRTACRRPPMSIRLSLLSPHRSQRA